MQDYKYGYKSTRQPSKCATKQPGHSIGELIHLIIASSFIFGVLFWGLNVFLNSFL
jgi:hypothetical protein